MVLVRRPGDCAEDSVREERKTREDRRSGCCASQDNAHVLYGRSWCCVQGAVPRAARSRGDGRGVSHSHHAGASSRRRWAGCCCDAVGSHVDACVSVQLELDIVHNGRVEACAPQRVGPTAGARRTRGCGCHGHNLGNTTLALSTAATQPMSIISVPPRCQALIHYPTRGRASHTPPGHSPARPPCAPPPPPPHPHPHTHPSTPTHTPTHTHAQPRPPHYFTAGGMGPDHQQCQVAVHLRAIGVQLPRTTHHMHLRCSSAVPRRTRARSVLGHGCGRAPWLDTTMS
jgi:hypothetical protein